MASPSVTAALPSARRECRRTERSTAPSVASRRRASVPLPQGNRASPSATSASPSARASSTRKAEVDRARRGQRAEAARVGAGEDYFPDIIRLTWRYPERPADSSVARPSATSRTLSASSTASPSPRRCPCTRPHSNAVPAWARTRCASWFRYRPQPLIGSRFFLVASLALTSRFVHRFVNPRSSAGKLRALQ